MRTTLALLLVLGSTLAATSSSLAGGNAQRSCATRAYTYAGFSSSHRSYGVAATLTALQTPDVLSGHVAGWVGVGGPGQGPNGSDEWLQVGMSGFQGAASELYYEVALPGQAPQYAKIQEVAPFEHHRVAVAEVRNRRSVWQVWVDSHPVADPIYLPGSHGRWAPIVTAESWNAGQPVCNSYAYRFGNVSSAGIAGGGWLPFRRGFRFQDRGYLLRVHRSSFTARARF